MTTPQPAALPEFMSDEWIIAIKKATKAADPTQPWGDTLAFAKALFAALQAQPAAAAAGVSDAEISRLWSWSATAEAERTATTQQHAFAYALLALRPQAVPMTPRMIELLAAMEPADQHEDNGSGLVICPACDAYMNMQWKAGQRIDKIEDLAHDEECPAVWARAQRAHGITAQGAQGGVDVCVFREYFDAHRALLAATQEHEDKSRTKVQGYRTPSQAQTFEPIEKTVHRNKILSRRADKAYAAYKSAQERFNNATRAAQGAQGGEAK